MTITFEEAVKLKDQWEQEQRANRPSRRHGSLEDIEAGRTAGITCPDCGRTGYLETRIHIAHPDLFGMEPLELAQDGHDPEDGEARWTFKTVWFDQLSPRSETSIQDALKAIARYRKETAREESELAEREQKLRALLPASGTEASSGS